MCDVYLWGIVERISPEAPVPVFECTGQQQVLGGAANVAANLHTLGCQVRLLGVVGTDATGRQVRELLRAQGMDDAWLVEDATRPTTEKTRLMASQQQVLRLDQECRTPLAPDLAAQVVHAGAALMADVDGVICSDYAKGVCTAAVLEPLLAAARTAGWPIIVDPKACDFTLYHGATVLTPNVAEVERASGTIIDHPDTLAPAVAGLLQQSQAPAMLVTRGQDGVTLFHPPQAPMHIPARARAIYDVTGAGDTVVAAFTMALLGGGSFAEAARLATTAAGIVVGKIGTAVVTPEELRVALREEASARC